MTVVEQPVGRRERKKLATRQALHLAALALTEEHGLAAVTVEAIAGRADVATRTFFNHFTSKEEAVLGWEPRRSEGLADDLQAALDAGHAPVDAVEAAVQASLAREAVDEETFAARMALVRREPLLLATSATQWERLTAAMTEVLGTHTGDPVYARTLVAASVGVARAAVHRWGGRPDSDLAAALREAFALLRAGFPDPTQEANR